MSPPAHEKCTEENVPIYPAEWAALETLRKAFGYKTRIDVVRKLTLTSSLPEVQEVKNQFHEPRKPVTGRKVNQ